MVRQTQPSVTYEQKNKIKIQIPFVVIAFYFVEWGLLRKDERKQKIDALMRANKFGLGNGFQSGWTTYKTYDPEEGEEEYRNSKIEGAFSNAYILASLPENVLPIDQRNENGDKKWIRAFLDLKTRNIVSQIDMIPWANLPQAYASAAWFNKDNTLLAFGIGTEEQKVAFKERKEERRAKAGQARRAKQEELNKIACALGDKCGHKGGARAAGPRIVDPRLKKEGKDVYHATCFPFYCSCTNVSWNKNKTCRSIDGEFDGKACSYGVNSVVDGRTGERVSPLYVELTEEKVKNLVNFKCLFIECKCELGDNCRCETSVNGKRGGYMSERWLNKTTGNRVTNCTPETLETMMSAKCKFIECKCDLGDDCRCETSVNGKRGGYMSEDWLDKRTGSLVENCTQESLETMMNAKCKFIECKCNLGDNCRCETSVNGKRGGYMSELWLNRITGDRVRNCTEDSLETMMNAKCKFIECKCNRGKEKGGCRCTVHRGVLPFGRQRGGWASSSWFDSKTKEQVYSFDKETLKTIMSGRCLERECDNCGRKGFASGICRPSPLTKGKFFCSGCAEFDVFKDERGCGICCRRLYVCKLSPEQMKDNMRRHKIKEKYMKKVVTAPKTLERDVHESCFRILRNDMIDRKEEEEREKLMRKFPGEKGLNKLLDKLADELSKL